MTGRDAVATLKHRFAYDLKATSATLLCVIVLYWGPDKNNTEGLRTALARLRNRTGPSIPQPHPSSTAIQPPQTITNSVSNAASPAADQQQQQQFQQPLTATNNNRAGSSSDGSTYQKNHDRYVPGSPIFREERKTLPITPAAPPSTPRSRTKGISDHPHHIQLQQQQQQKLQSCAMTVSVTNASQGAAVVTTKTTTPPASMSARCYTSTRSAAMMALAMGQRTKSPVSVPRAVVNKPRPSVQPSPTSIGRSTSAAPPAAPTKSAVVPPAGVQINGIALSQSGGSGSSGSDNDGFNSSSSSTATALRRLYFKSGRSAKSKVNATATTSMMGDELVTGGTTTYHETTATPAAGSAAVPKVVVMGSSSASVPDTMISTSTDSASTVVTSVTHTDTSEACDSLDLGDTSGQSEPLFSSLEEPLLTAIQIDSEHDGTELELTTSSMYSRPRMNLQDSIESQESSLSILVSEHTSTTPLLATPPRRSGGDISRERLPNTAPAPSSDISHFTFDPPEPPMSARSSEKSDSHFTFQDPPLAMNGGRQITPSSSRRNFDESKVSNSSLRRENSPNSRSHLRSYTATSAQRGGYSDFYYDYERECDQNVERSPTRSKKSRIRDSSSSSVTRNRYSTSAAVVSNAIKTSPKREMRRSPSSTKLTSAPPNVRDNNYFGCSGNKPKQLSPSSQYAANQRKYSSSSSSGGSERDREHDRERERERERSTDISMFPFDREALDYERIQRECFAVEEHSSSATVSSDSDEAEHCSVYERKLSAHHGLSPKSSDIFQQYKLLSQQEQPAAISSALSGGPSSRKNSKRVRPKSAMSQKIIPRPDAFHPKPQSSYSPGEHSQSQQAHKSHAELNKFDEIASKFDQIPPKHSGSNANLAASHHHVSTIMNNNQTADGGGSGGGLYRSSNNNTGGSAGTLHNNSSPTGSMRAASPPPAMPDLRVDFFSEVQVHHPQRKSFKCKAAATAATSASYSDNLDGYQRGGGLINVTSNPLEIAAVCTQPRATIVVQQPSLSLDSAVETLLIKNEGDFISVEHGKDLARKRNSQQLQHPSHLPQHLHQHQQQQQQPQQQTQQQQKLKRDENIRQLLDVTNTLTFEELRDFEMRYGSPHHSRSQSVKTPGSRASGRPNQLCLPQQRSRVASMPNTGVEEEYYRLRHFSITGKGVVNRGDSLKSRRSRSNNSVASSNSSTEHLTAAQIPASTSARTSATCSLASSRESSTSNPGNGPYRVLMLGGTAVGKSSLVSQFMTSEYLHAYDTSIDDESGEKSVSVLLSGEESELIFIDHAYTEMAPDDSLGSYDPHGYCVIYSASDRSSFTIAEHVLQVLWTNQNIAQKAVILVGNKADLARSRSVTIEEGKAMATAYDCKFIETSVGINHNVDELLVGLLSQIRLKLENPEKSRDLFRKRSIRKSKRRACSPLGGVCLTGGGGVGGTSPNTPLGGPAANNVINNTPPGSAHSSPRKYRGSRTSTSLKVKGLLGRVWARDSKSKSCENLHVL